MEENMEERSVSPLRVRGILSSTASSPSIRSSKVKCYMTGGFIDSEYPSVLNFITDIIVDCISDASDHPITIAMQMNVELLNDATHDGQILLFKKISSSEWKYDRIVELTDELTFKASVDDMGRIGSVNLGKTEVERFRSAMEPTETVHDFWTEQEDCPRFRLKSKIISIQLEGEYSKEGFTYMLNKDSESTFSMVRDLPDHTTNKPMFLDACEACFLESFEKNQSKDDIDNCVLANRLMLQLLAREIVPPLKFLDYHGVTSAGGNQLKGDINKSVTGLDHVKDATVNIHPQLPFLLNRIGAMLLLRCENIGDVGDVIEAISLQRKGVHLTPEGHPSRPSYLTNLGKSLQHRFSCTGELTDISEAISFQQKAVHLTSEGHPNRPMNLASLGNSLLHRFSQTGELKDISEAISFLQKAVQLTPEGHPNRPINLTSLGRSLIHRFSHTGEITDISEAISCLQKAVQITPEGHPEGPNNLTALGDSLRLRFSHTRELTDLSEAISFLQKAVQITPEGHPNRPMNFTSLGTSLRHRYTCTGELTDISEAISFLQKAVQITPEHHPNKPINLTSLGNSLIHQFSHTGELTDISEAISFLQKAIKITPEGHPEGPKSLDLLGNSLRHRFTRTGELTDISEAISFLQKAIELTPDGHPFIAQILSSLALSFSSCFGHTRDITDICAAISKLSLAANLNSGSPSVRLNAAKDWVKLSQEYDPTQLLDAHQATIRLISRVAGLEQTIQKRHNNLIEISTLSTLAAAAAFASGEISLALEWLEQGRCLVWSQLNDLRTPFDILQSYDPEIANELMNVSRALENAGSQVESPISIVEASMSQKSSLQDQMATHAKLAQRWDQLLAKVRNIPDFEDFLRPPSSSSLLRGLPNSGIVIVINVHQDRCDALALRSGIEPLHIALPEFSYNKADNLRKDLNIRLWDAGFRMREYKPDDHLGIRRLGPAHDTSLQQILALLWILVVKPILNGLGYSEPPCDLMRIWWCLSGPLAFLPIHAAGIYDGSNPEISSTLSDFAVSSYTPTVRALVDSVKSPPEFDKGNSGLFMVSQPDTPDLPHIPGTTEEVRRVQQKLTSRDVQVLHLDSAAATVDRGIANMKAYSCIHFACHAQQNTEKPLKSGFSLYDGRLELSSIIQQRLVGADLAFLSACQTSAGDEKLSEEAVHLAAGMLAAGYRGVVATMWSIRDEYGPIIAEDFYSNLIQDSDRLSGEYAARALHHATQNLRKSLGDSESALLTWVPYVHFGL